MNTTIIEHYEHAAQASEIVVTAEHRTSADYLLAAAFAQAGSPRNRAAISLYRLHLNKRAEDVEAVRAWAMWMLPRQFQRGHSAVRTAAARQIFEKVLHWWLEGVCPTCEGRKFELVPGTQIISEHRCKTCDGAGREPVTHRLPRRHQDPGRWLADQMDNMLSWVEADMARLLR